MRKISADYIFTMAGEPIHNGIVTVGNDGTILSIESKNTYNDSEIEHYEGIICPGFINTHCHLELSHMRSKIAEKLGMAGFIKAIISTRSNFSAEEMQQAINSAEEEMIQNGIVAVGDISNNNSTFETKKKKKLHYHTFIELFDITPGKAEQVFNKGKELLKEHQTFSNNCSLVPHAPYTVSEKLLALIQDYTTKNKVIESIHNQESQAENDFFTSQSGPIYESFQKMGINLDDRKKANINALNYTLPYLTKSERLLLVHNTFTSKEDILWGNELLNKRNNPKSKIQNPKSQIQNPKSKISNLYWCTCPNANLYIENKLPDYNLFIEANAKVTIGTDSLASNWSLSILDELKTISAHYPAIPLQTLLLWATKNGAEFLGLDHLGTIEKGKQPGLNLLSNVNEKKIGKTTSVKRLV